MKHQGIYSIETPKKVVLDSKAWGKESKDLIIFVKIVSTF